MAQPGNLGDLEQPHELAFQTREWQVGRVVWALIFTIVGFTVLGLFGTGPLSSVTLASPDRALRVQSQRFTRYGASLRVIVDLTADDRGVAVMRLGRPYLTSMRVEQILPQPDATQQDHEGVTFRFSGNPPGADVRVILDLQSARRGRVGGQLSSGGRRVDITHFVYP